MALNKREYIPDETVITAENLNEIQDEVIRIGNKLDGGELQEEVQAMIDAAIASIETGGGVEYKLLEIEFIPTNVVIPT